MVHTGDMSLSYICTQESDVSHAKIAFTKLIFQGKLQAAVHRSAERPREGVLCLAKMVEVTTPS